MTPRTGRGATITTTTTIGVVVCYDGDDPQYGGRPVLSPRGEREWYGPGPWPVWLTVTVRRDGGVWRAVAARPAADEDFDLQALATATTGEQRLGAVYRHPVDAKTGPTPPKGGRVAARVRESADAYRAAMARNADMDALRVALQARSPDRRQVALIVAHLGWPELGAHRGGSTFELRWPDPTAALATGVVAVQSVEGYVWYDGCPWLAPPVESYEFDGNVVHAVGRRPVWGYPHVGRPTRRYLASSDPAMAAVRRALGAFLPTPRDAAVEYRAALPALAERQAWIDVAVRRGVLRADVSQSVVRVATPPHRHYGRHENADGRVEIVESGGTRCQVYWHCRYTWTLPISPQEVGLDCEPLVESGGCVMDLPPREPMPVARVLVRPDPYGLAVWDEADRAEWTALADTAEQEATSLYRRTAEAIEARLASYREV